LPIRPKPQTPYSNAWTLNASRRASRPYHPAGLLVYNTVRGAEPARRLFAFDTDFSAYVNLNVPKAGCSGLRVEDQGPKVQ